MTNTSMIPEYIKSNCQHQSNRKMKKTRRGKSFLFEQSQAPNGPFNEDILDPNIVFISDKSNAERKNH